MSKKSVLLTIVYMFTPFFLWNCSSSSDSLYVSSVNKQDVYVIADTANGPAYWVNGVKREMAKPTGNMPFSIRSLTVKGEKVYAAGSAVWADGAVKPIEFYFGTASSIAVSEDGDVYVGGWYGLNVIKSEISLDPVKSKAFFLKNDKPQRLNNLPADSSITSIAVSQSGDVYVAGHYYDQSSNIEKAFLLKNGNMELLNLPQGDLSFYANSVTVSQLGDVYVAGNYYDQSSNIEKAFLLKNGNAEPLNLPAETFASYAHSVAVSDSGDVYVACSVVTPTGDTGMLFKNGNMEILPEPPNDPSMLIESAALSPDGYPYVLSYSYNGSNSFLYRNGVTAPVTVGSVQYNIHAYSVAVSQNNDTYVAGKGRFLSESFLLKNGNEEALNLPDTWDDLQYWVSVSHSGDLFVAGSYVEYPGFQTAFVLKNNVMQPLSLPSHAQSSYAFSVTVSKYNDTYVSGNYEDPFGFVHAFLLKNGYERRLNLPGDEWESYLTSVAVSDNNDVYAAGLYVDYKNARKAFLLKNGEMQTLKVPDGVTDYSAETVAVGDNGAVYVGGYYFINDIMRAVVWINGEPQEYDGSVIKKIIIR